MARSIRPIARRLWVTAAYAVIMIAGACGVMWPYLRHFTDSAIPHQDVYFNVWRLSWFAHAITTSGGSLWDANIVAPEHWTFAMSDAILAEGLVGTLLFRCHVPPMAVHNCVLIGGMVGSGMAMAVFARYLTSDFGAGAIAGLIFAYAPYRMEHVMHLELQWAIWIPMAFLALHLAVATGRWQYGMLAGLAVALQMLSCVYYGVFLLTILPIAALVIAAADPARARRRSAILGLVMGVAMTAAVTWIYAVPYRHAEQVVGPRAVTDVATYSATLRDYAAVPGTSWLYGGALGRLGGPERRLFIGAIATALALLGLVSARRRVDPWVYLLLALIAVAMSLGTNGFLYDVARDYLLPYRGLRAPARFGIMVLFFVSVLAAYGYQKLADGRSAWVSAALLVAVTAGLLLEYRTVIPLHAYPNTPPAVYKVLSRLPRGSVAEFPMPLPHTLPGNEAEYQYMSTFHWNAMANGYSGTYPQSYLLRLARLRAFPDRRSVEQLQQDHIRYVVVHLAAYTPADAAQMLLVLEGLRWGRVGRFSDGNADAVLYQLPEP